MNFGTFGFPKKAISSAASEVVGGAGTITLTATSAISAGDIVGYGDSGVTPLPAVTQPRSVAEYLDFAMQSKVSPSQPGHAGAFSAGAAALSNNTFVSFFAEYTTIYPVFEIYNANLTVAVAKTRVSAIAALVGNRTLDVAALTGGGFVVTYIKASDSSVWFARYDNSGVIQGSVTQLGTTTSATFCKVVGLTGGGFAVSSWVSGAIHYGVYSSTSAVVKAPANTTHVTTSGNDTCIVDRVGGGFAIIAANAASTTTKGFLYDAAGVYVSTNTLTNSNTSDPSYVRSAVRTSYGIVICSYLETSSYTGETRVFVDNGTALVGIRNSVNDHGNINGLSTSSTRIALAFSGSFGFAAQYAATPVIKITRLSALGRGFGGTVSIPCGSSAHPILIALTDGSYVLMVLRTNYETTFYLAARAVPSDITVSRTIPNSTLQVVVGPQLLQTIQTLTYNNDSCRLTAIARPDGGALVLFGEGAATGLSGLVVGVNGEGVVDTPVMSYATADFRNYYSCEAMCALTGGGYVLFHANALSYVGLNRIVFLDASFNVVSMTSLAAITLYSGSYWADRIAICATLDGGCFLTYVTSDSWTTVKVTKFSSAGAVLINNVTVDAALTNYASRVACVAAPNGNVYVTHHGSSAAQTIGMLHVVTPSGVVTQLAQFNTTTNGVTQVQVLSNRDIAILATTSIYIYSPVGALRKTIEQVAPANQILGGSIKALPTGGFVYSAILATGISLTVYDNGGEIVIPAKTITLGAMSTQTSITMTTLGNGDLLIPYNQSDSRPRVMRVRINAPILLGVAQNSAGIGDEVTLQNSSPSGAQIGLPLSADWGSTPISFDHRSLGGAAGFIQGSTVLIRPTEFTARNIA